MTLLMPEALFSGQLVHPRGIWILGGIDLETLPIFANAGVRTHQPARNIRCIVQFSEATSRNRFLVHPLVAVPANTGLHEIDSGVYVGHGIPFAAKLAGQQFFIGYNHAM
jgi:hypothetical protein